MSAQVLAVVRGGARLRASAWAPGGPAANFAAAVPSLLGCEVLATAVASEGLVDVLAQALEGTAGAPPEDAVVAQLKVSARCVMFHLGRVLLAVLVRSWAARAKDEC